MPGLETPREVRVKTPFGNPSDAFVVGTLEGSASHFCAPRPRPPIHAHRKSIIAPIFTRMKLLGVERIISVSAVGSLREELRPLEFLIPDQFYDRTRRASPHFSATAWWRTSASTSPCARN